MQKNKENPTTWGEIEKKHAEMQLRETLASEVIAWNRKISKAKDFSVFCLSVVTVIFGIMIFRMKKGHRKR